MANNKTADLTIKIGGIPVKGRVQTDLDTGNSKWSPYATGVGGIQVVTNLDTIYLESKKNPDGKYTPWQSKGSIDVFEYLADNNPQINSAYSGDKQKVLTAFYSTTTSTDTLNSGRLNQFNTNGAPQTAKTLGIPGAVNTSSPSETGAPSDTPPATDPKDIQSLSINGEVASNKTRSNYGADKDLTYPLDRSDDQDYIKFTMFKYDGRELGGEGGITKDNISTFKPGKRRLTKLKGSVTLPIQPSITDSNGVEWGGPNLSGPDAYLASLSLGGMNSREGLTGMLSDLMGRVQQDLKTIADTADFKNAIKLYLAQEAVGTQGLLSRATGAIINPNLELLFNGPTLRPFNFTFRLSPRSEPEANNVKRIIRFFKQGMSVKTAPSNIFLKAPNLFDISYIGKSSTSLNKIKTCALLSCDVDYTPDGTYMTFSDGTMTSYQITLRFSEVDPIYEEDYNDLSETEIGY